MSSEVWIADSYLRPGSTLRTQGVLDLLARVRHPAPRLIADLGCGPGNNTELIAARWPQARVTGVDNSPDMIAAARQREQPGHLEFREADLTVWEPEEPVDIVLLSAVLQWVPGHAALLPRFAAMLAPGGVLGFQMPGAHRTRGDLLDIGQQIAGEPQWRDKLSGAYHEDEILDSLGYLTALGDAGLRAEAWETWYTYLLPGTGRLVEYATGAMLRPALARLSPAESERFLAEYSRRVSEAFPPRVIAGQQVEVLRQARIFVVGQSPG